MVAQVYVRVSRDSAHHKVISLQQEGRAMSSSFRQKFKHFMQHDDEDYCDKRGFWTIMWQNAALMTKNPLPFSSWPFFGSDRQEMTNRGYRLAPPCSNFYYFPPTWHDGGKKSERHTLYSTAVEEM